MATAGGKMILYEPIISSVTSIEELRKREKYLIQRTVKEFIKIVNEQIEKYKSKVQERYKRRYNILNRVFRKLKQWL